MRKFLILSLLAIFNFAISQIEQPVKWSFDSKKIDNTNVELIFKAKIESGWKIYGMSIPKDGPVPTTFSFNSLQNVELVGKVSSLAKPHEKEDKMFGMKIQYFTDEAVFVQKIKIKDVSKASSIKGLVEYMSCNNQSCTPPDEQEFAFNFKPENASVSTINNSEIKANANSEAPIKIQNIDNTSNSSLIWIFVMAFLGGLAAILTPCVFPMIPMTVSFFIKSKKKINAIIYGASIIFIYTVIGTIVAVLFGASFANFISTHWFPNVLFFVIFTIFAISFFGAFEIALPSWIVDKSVKNEERGQILGSFFMALTLVLVSFSCTGPIVGAILVVSAEGEVIRPIIGMLGFSLAFAFPFTFFALFPSFMERLPKSGSWLNSVKVTLGFVELALGLKFLSIADQAYHWGLLDRDVYLILWTIIAILLGLYLVGLLRFPHDSKSQKVGYIRRSLGVISLVFGVYLSLGLFGFPLKALSGYMPPQLETDLNLSKLFSAQKSESHKQKGLLKDSFNEDIKYSDFLHLPHGLTGYYDLSQALKASERLGKPLFIDFTGHGCVNCRKMEANVWSAPEVLSILKNDYIVVAIYVDDKTELPKNEWITSKVDGKLKKTLGKRNADYLISTFAVNAQPYYILMDEQQKVLTQPKAYDTEVNAFVAFLKSGIQRYKEMHNK